MKLRLLLSIAGPVAVTVYFLHYNRGFIDLHLTETWQVRLPLALVVFGAALAGAVVAALLGWGEAAIGGLGRWRARRRERRTERARERLAHAQRLRSEGRLRRARREARRALRDDPRLGAALRFAGDLAAEAGNLDEAIRWNERLHTITEDMPEAVVRLSENLFEMGRAAEAERLLSQACGNGRAHPVVVRRLRDHYRQMGRWDEALSACEKLVRLGATEAVRRADEVVAADIYLAAGEAKLRATEPDAAISLLEQAVRRLPNQARPLLALGDAHAAAGKTKRAMRMWEGGYREAGEAGFLHRILTAHGPLEAEGAKRKAASAMVSAGKLRPDDPLPLVMAAALLLDAGRAEEAGRWMESASERILLQDGNEPWTSLVLHLLEARGKLEAGDRLAAESDFKKVALEAGRVILGRQAAGVELKPYDEVADESG